MLAKLMRIVPKVLLSVFLLFELGTFVLCLVTVNPANGSRLEGAIVAWREFNVLFWWTLSQIPAWLLWSVGIA